MNIKNALVFTEDNNLFIRKPNGLEYEFQNVDKPELGFEYDVVVYDDIEIKIMKWNREVGFDMQEKTDLSESEKSMVEQYIACLLYTSPSPRDQRGSRVAASA